MTEELKQGPPRRYLDKEEAVRHLIHCAIRMVMREEDPFAIHLLVQSADKMLGDLAKQRKTQLAFDWETIVREDKREAFFRAYREAYNYFKHANHDFDRDLPVRQITMMNVHGLLTCTVNYRSVFGLTTGHMSFFTGFASALMPTVFDLPEDQRAAFDAGLREIGDLTPRRFFELTPQVEWMKRLDLDGERAADTKDHGDFYETSFGEFTRPEADKADAAMSANCRQDRQKT